jgi:GT2 family glycosyltransferase
MRVIVVDNGSTDNSVEMIARHFPEHDLLCLSENIGFASGCNQGIEYAIQINAVTEVTDFILLLNNDTIVEPEFLDYLVMSSDQQTAAVTGKIYFLSEEKTKPSIIWASGGQLNLRWAGGGNRGRGQRDDGQFDNAEDIAFATGCCMLVRLSAIATVGLLNDGYFAYHEDSEWALRARKAGFRIRYEPRALVWHAVAQASKTTPNREGVLSPFVYFLNARNQLWLLRVHASNMQKLTAYPAYIVRRLLFYSVAFIVLRRWRKLRSLWHGFFAGCTTPPQPVVNKDLLFEHMQVDTHE